MSFLKALAGGVVALIGAAFLMGGASTSIHGDATISIIGVILLVIGLLYAKYEFRH